VGLRLFEERKKETYELEFDVLVGIDLSSTVGLRLSKSPIPAAISTPVGIDLSSTVGLRHADIVDALDA